jgi:3-methyladenine DNA glycosylase AlkD
LEREAAVDAESVLRELKSRGSPAAVKGMARFGISSKNTLGVSIPTIRGLAKKLGKDHALALALWESGIHEARLLAPMVDEPVKVTEAQMEKWVRDFDSWDVCDQCCSNLFDRTRLAYGKAAEWARREPEFVKRAGFALMAALAVHDKDADDKAFATFFELIEKGSTDERNFVKKAVNWALRQIGKRNARLNREALAAAKEISKLKSPAARWVASDAIRELRSGAVQSRLRRSSAA